MNEMPRPSFFIRKLPFRGSVPTVFADHYYQRCVVAYVKRNYFSDRMVWLLIKTNKGFVAFQRTFRPCRMYGFTSTTICPVDFGLFWNMFKRAVSNDNDLSDRMSFHFKIFDEKEFEEYKKWAITDSI